MISVSALAIAETVRPDFNGNVDAIGIMDNFRLRLDAETSPQDAGLAYPGKPSILVCWRVPREDRGTAWEGKIEVWADGERKQVLGKADIDTRAHSTKWMVQLTGLPLHVEGEHEIRAYARLKCAEPRDWGDPLGVLPYMVTVDRVERPVLETAAATGTSSSRTAGIRLPFRSNRS